MIIYGYYTIPIRTIKSNELPVSLHPEPGAIYQSIAEVVHVMWIPVFPYQKLWIIKKDGQRFQTTPQTTQILNQLFGTPRMPWYAFALPLLLLIGSTIYEINSILNERHNKQVEAKALGRKRQKMRPFINTPSEHDYFTFKYPNGNSVVLKTQSFQQDSIVFIVPLKRSGSSELISESEIAGFFVNPTSKTTTCSFAKSDLVQIFDNAPEEGQFVNKGPISAFFNGKEIRIDNIKRLSPRLVEASYHDPKTEEEVRNAAITWLSACKNLDSSMMLIDSQSINYFKNMLIVARTGSFEEMKTFVESSQHPFPTYRYMLHTKFIYQKSVNTSTNIKDYCQFLKELNEGFWGLHFDSSIAHFDTITFSHPQRANLAVTVSSNKLEDVKPIHFRLVFNKEDGKWKMNVISSLSYSTTQIRENMCYNGYSTQLIEKNMPFSNDQDKNYRQLIIEEVKKIGSKKHPVQIGAEWAY